MTKEQISELDDLRRRLARLEDVPKPKQRGWCNQKAAAAYLGRSEEWLRQQVNAGRGPKRQRHGPRVWAYKYDDLDAYVMQGEETAA